MTVVAALSCALRVYDADTGWALIYFGHFVTTPTFHIRRSRYATDSFEVDDPPGVTTDVLFMSINKSIMISRPISRNRTWVSEYETFTRQGIPQF